MINVGITGVGFMGWIHWLAYQQVPGIRVAAIASSDPAKRAGDWSTIEGNFGPQGTQVDLSDVNVYTSLEEMLGDDSIDVIDICLPPSHHAAAIEQSFLAGKHVFSEKPLALHSAQCKASIQQSVAADRMLLVGHVLPWFAEFQFAVQAIESGEYGRLTGGTFKRIVSDPKWLKDYWDREIVGGPLLDLHVHDAHLIRMLFGMPKTCYSSGKMRDGVPEFFHSMLLFDDPDVTVSATCGAIAQQGRPFCHGYEIYLERATLQFELSAYSDSSETIEAKIIPNDGPPIRLSRVDGDPVLAFVRQMEEVRNTINNRLPSKVLDGQLASDAIAICEAQERSIVSGLVESV